MRLQRVSLFVFAALALACGGDDRPVLKVGVNGTAFQLESVPTTGTSGLATVPFMTWNRGNATAFIPTCGTRVLPIVEKFSNGSWDAYASGFCLAVQAFAPVELRVGESRDDEVTIGETGHYRLRMVYWGDAGAKKRYETVSGEFDVQ